MPPAVESYAELAARILRRPARLGRTRLVAVDGPSGAGKTVFAGRLAAALDVPRLDVPAARDDDDLDGWLGKPAAGRARRRPIRCGSAELETPETSDEPETAEPSDEPETPETSDGPEGPARLETPVVHTDDLLDGWTDQFTFWARLDEWVLGPLRAGRPGRYRRYDWTRGRFTRAWVPVPPAPVVILEGVSSARSAIAAELTLAVFVTAPARLRRHRTLIRDGAALVPQLTVWRHAEQAHFAADRTAERADLVVDGAADPARDGAFVRAR